MSDAEKQLEAAIQPLRENRFRCTACGNIINDEGDDVDRGMVRKLGTSAKDHRQPSLSFYISGCIGCGHIMRWFSRAKVRDLTRAEAEELYRSKDWPRIRKVVERVVAPMFG